MRLLVSWIEKKKRIYGDEFLWEKTIPKRCKIPHLIKTKSILNQIFQFPRLSYLYFLLKQNSKWAKIDSPFKSKVRFPMAYLFNRKYFTYISQKISRRTRPEGRRPYYFEIKMSKNILFNIHFDRNKISSRTFHRWWYFTTLDVAFNKASVSQIQNFPHWCNHNCI